MRKPRVITQTLVAVLIVLTIASCENNNKSQTGQDKTPSGITDNKVPEKVAGENEVLPEKHDITMEVIDAYLLIKNGLVADSKVQTTQGAESMLAAFANVDIHNLEEASQRQYEEIQESAKEHAEHIKKSQIDHQREHFEILTTDIMDLVNLLGTDKTLYQDFCPMANNNKGAFWLSEVEEIRNPYFGAKMLKCGTIKKQIN